MKCLYQDTTRWQVRVATELYGFVSRQWVLCHDMILSWQGVLGSRLCLLSVVTRPQQRFPYGD